MPATSKKRSLWLSAAAVLVLAGALGAFWLQNRAATDKVQQVVQFSYSLPLGYSKQLASSANTNSGTQPPDNLTEKPEAALGYVLSEKGFESYNIDFASIFGKALAGSEYRTRVELVQVSKVSDVRSNFSAKVTLYQKDKAVETAVLTGYVEFDGQKKIRLFHQDKDTLQKLKTWRQLAVPAAKTAVAKEGLTYAFTFPNPEIKAVFGPALAACSDPSSRLPVPDWEGAVDKKLSAFFTADGRGVFKRALFYQNGLLFANTSHTAAPEDLALTLSADSKKADYKLRLPVKENGAQLKELSLEGQLELAEDGRIAFFALSPASLETLKSLGMETDPLTYGADIAAALRAPCRLRMTSAAGATG